MNERETDFQKIKGSWKKLAADKELMSKVLTAYMKKHFSNEVEVVVKMKTDFYKEATNLFDGNIEGGEKK
jgi:hypothetical protein